MYNMHPPFALHKMKYPKMFDHSDCANILHSEGCISVTWTTLIDSVPEVSNSFRACVSRIARSIRGN